MPRIPDSTAGIEAVAAGRSGTSSPYQVKFIPDNTGSVASPLSSTSTTPPSASQYNYPDLSLSDTFQSTTPFTGKVTEKGPTNSTSFTATYADLSGSAVQLGIEPYVFVASPGANAAGLTNITTSQAQLLYENGALPLAFFTGKSTDEGTLVYGLTRDGGSGARLGLVTETGIGTKTALVTYKPTVGGGSTDNRRQQRWRNDLRRDQPLSGRPDPQHGLWDNTAGDTGYSSSARCSRRSRPHPRRVRSSSPTSTCRTARKRSATASRKNADTLSYNGTPAFTGSAPFTTAAFNQAAVQEGKYTFWAYEWLYPSPSAGTAAQSVISTLEGSWTATTPTSSVNVFRQSDGGPVLQNY